MDAVGEWVGRAGQSVTRRWRRRVTLLLCAALAGSAPLLGCASRGEPKKACAVFIASENLNLYDGEPHPITVYLYPLESPAGFEHATVSELKQQGPQNPA